LIKEETLSVVRPHDVVLLRHAGKGERKRAERRQKRVPSRRNRLCAEGTTPPQAVHQRWQPQYDGVVGGLRASVLVPPRGDHRRRHWAPPVCKKSVPIGTRVLLYI